MIRQLSRRLVLSTAAALLVTGAMAAVVVVAQQRAAAAMTTAAQEFLSSLTPDQRQRAVFPLQSEEWTRWNFVPTTMFPRQGVTLKDMTEAQRQRAHALLQAGLSQPGYKTATDIMSLEAILKVIEDRQRAEAAAKGGRGPGDFNRDPELYFFSVFGEPSTTGQWGWRVEGHHLSLHFAVDGTRTLVRSAPLFFGSNPAEVREGPQTGRRVLAQQEDAARELLMALDQTQRSTALVSDTAQGDIATRTNVTVEPLTPSGLAAAQMTAAQREILMKVVDSYNSAVHPDIAADRMTKMREAGLEKISFAWFGSTDKGQRYYYRVQGPTFLIEHNNTQGNGNHIHSVWRDFNGDFGRDILAEHMAMYRH